MEILLLCRAGEWRLQEIVYKALLRTFTEGQVKKTSVVSWREKILLGQKMAVVVINPTTEWHQYIDQTLAVKGSKVLLLGRLPANIATHLQIEVNEFDSIERQSFECSPAVAGDHSDSRANIFYRGPQHLGIESPMVRRSCLHYDFMAEWNNLGFGAVRCDDSIWSLASHATIEQENRLADVLIDDNLLCSYAGLWQEHGSSLLWFNRQVGPVDSQEWRLVEYFFSSYKFSTSVCLAALSEIPLGYDACVTMRLDCDEDISSSRQLFQLYQDLSVPFSLALHTSVFEAADHSEFLAEVVESGGALLSHSVTHPVNWGGSYDGAAFQSIHSRLAIKALLPDAKVDYAVSPFHQNPEYALNALADAGYWGFIGGIVCNDPEYLMARSGECPFVNTGFIGHSQQCMLHGESMLEHLDPLANYKQAFDIARAGRSLFGYLDHPFSPRYQYGWQSESQRSKAHKLLIEYISSKGDVLFLSQNDAMDWLRLKSSVVISRSSDGPLVLEYNSQLYNQWHPVVEYMDELMPLHDLNG